jgi:hypothetical protein
MALPTITSPRFQNTAESFYPKKESFEFSPKHAAQDLINSMTVTGNKFGVARTPKEKPFKAQRKSLPPREVIDLQDYVKTVRGGTSFGHDFYDLPSNEMLLKRVQFGHTDKLKHISFAEEVQKKK